MGKQETGKSSILISGRRRIIEREEVSLSGEIHTNANITFIVNCRPFNLPVEFLSVIITAVYIPSQANTTSALKKLYGVINKQGTAHPEAVLLMGGDLKLFYLTATKVGR